jgi:hypothetical protein
MLTIVFSFLVGAAVGATGTFFVVRNNKAKALRAMDKVDDYKNYMTKWSDAIKNEKKD